MEFSPLRTPNDLDDRHASKRRTDADNCTLRVPLIANLESADYYYQGPRISPNKRWIAYTEVSRDWALPNKTGDDVATILVKVRKVGSKKGRRIFVSYGREWAPVVAAWSADSKRVLFWRIVYYGASSVNADGLKLFDIARAGGRSTQLALQRQQSEDDAAILL